MALVETSCSRCKLCCGTVIGMNLMTLKKTGSTVVSPGLDSRGGWTAVMQSRWGVLALACLPFVACYFRAFVSGVPVLLWGDQLGFATNATRMLAGQLPYRDYFDFVTPGTELVYALLFRVFGVTLWIPNLVMACLAAVTALLMTLYARRIVGGVLVALPTLLLTGFVLYGSLDATHHWFSTVFVLAAMLVLIDAKTLWRIAGAGALCGLTAGFTQSKGAAVLGGFVVYLVWTSRQEESRAGEIWRRCMVLCGAALVVFAAMDAPFIYAAGFRRWFECVIVFPLRYYPSVPINNWRGTLADFTRHDGVMKWVCVPFVYAVVPAAYFVFIGIMRKRWRLERGVQWRDLLLVAITGLAMFVAVAPALNIKRVSSVSPPALILVAWILSRREGWSKLAMWLGGVSVGVAAISVARTQIMPVSYLDLPAGRVAIREPAQYEVYRWMKEHTRPGQMYFGMPSMYLPFGLVNPTPIDAPAPSEYGRPEQIAAAIEGLERSRAPVLLLRQSMYIPHLLGYPADHLQPFQDYLYQNYRRIKSFSTGDEVWERVDRSKPVAPARN